MCGWTNMNRDFLYLDGPSRACLDSIWRESCDLGYGITNLCCGEWQENANCRAPELENWADFDVQVKLIVTVWYLTRLSLHDDHPNLWRYSVQGPTRKQFKCISWIWVAKTTGAFQSLLCVNTKFQTWPQKYIERRYYKLRHIWGKKTMWTTYCRLSFGVLLACERNSKHICVSIINKRLSYPQRQTYTILHNRLAVGYCMKSWISGGILYAWAVFL